MQKFLSTPLAVSRQESITPLTLHQEASSWEEGRSKQIKNSAMDQSWFKHIPGPIHSTYMHIAVSADIQAFFFSQMSTFFSSFCIFHAFYEYFSSLGGYEFEKVAPENAHEKRPECIFLHVYVFEC